MIRAASDSDGIYQAALQMLENSMGEADRERQMLSIAPDDLEQAAKLAPRNDFAQGYQDRVLYLVWLKNQMDAGIAFGNISAEEADGIVAVDRARGQFEADHPQCGGCGQRLRFRGQKHCPNCTRELS